VLAACPGWAASTHAPEYLLLYVLCCVARVQYLMLECLLQVALCPTVHLHVLTMSWRRSVTYQHPTTKTAAVGCIKIKNSSC